MFSRILSDISWVLELHILFSRIVLCDHWYDSSDGSLRWWYIFAFFIKRMHKLFSRLLFSKRWVVKLHELFGREVS